MNETWSFFEKYGVCSKIIANEALFTKTEINIIFLEIHMICLNSIETQTVFTKAKMKRNETLTFLEMWSVFKSIEIEVVFTNIEINNEPDDNFHENTSLSI